MLCRQVRACIVIYVRKGGNTPRKNLNERKNKMEATSANLAEICNWVVERKDRTPNASISRRAVLTGCGRKTSFTIDDLWTTTTCPWCKKKAVGKYVDYEIADMDK